jgi:hypothetical protein
MSNSPGVIAVVSAGLVLAITGVAQGQWLGGNVGLFKHPRLRDELKLTETQIEKGETLIAAFEKQFRAAVGEMRGKPLTREEKAEELFRISQRITAALEKDLPSILDPDQLKRFQQVERQQSGVGALSCASVKDALSLTTEQAGQIEAIVRDLLRAQVNLAREFPERQQLQDKMARWQGMQSEALDKALALLTEEQRNAWVSLIGEPFEIPGR